ncbi:hypothetical protein GCM10007874_34800 [Labrys miyagiensis]|uniref:Glycerophosphoryl diester phosphodiesterase membrane domain-containing protein n=1 Tax=Labrys miyagiensis TaxID=346912 RepID=A0ABQ6CJE8_9HYPH|nr:hypothetical protein [Labrys miyagiensis]GLS20463.1 hypothetical protein GCM10007874_34800 [Labrys miyagiensis]
MTTQVENALPTPREPLGVGSIISDALGIASRNILPFVVLTIPVLIAYGVYTLFMIRALGAQATMFTPGQVPDFSVLASIYLWQIPIYLVWIACFNAISLYADGKWNMRRQPIFSSLLAGTVRVPHVLAIWIMLAIPMIVFLTVVTSLLLHFVNVLWLDEALIWLGMIVISVLLFPFILAGQACVIGKTGPITALRQSAQLTQRYRWPLFGLLLLMMLVGILLMLGLMIELVIFRFIPILGAIVSVVTVLLLPTFFFAWYGTILAIAYGRLNLIKNGVPQTKIANVFD